MKKSLLFTLLFLFLINCDKNNDTDCFEVACTQNFLTLLVSVKDASGAAVSLDSFEVLDKESLQNLTIELSDNAWQMARQNGQYPMYDDSFVLGNLNTKRALIFRGFINSEKVAEAEYVVETDCCHVGMSTGDTDIIIN